MELILAIADLIINVSLISKARDCYREIREIQEIGKRI